MCDRTFLLHVRCSEDFYERHPATHDNQIGRGEEGKPDVNGLHQGSILVYNFSGIRCSSLLVFPIPVNEKGREK